MVTDHDNAILKHLVEKTDLRNIAELKCEKHGKKVFKALLEIDKRRFDVSVWSEACAYFMCKSQEFTTVDEARHGLMSFMNKERWCFWI